MTLREGGREGRREGGKEGEKEGGRHAGNGDIVCAAWLCAIMYTQRLVERDKVRVGEGRV